MIQKHLFSPTLIFNNYLRKMICEFFNSLITKLIKRPIETRSECKPATHLQPGVLWPATSFMTVLWTWQLAKESASIGQTNSPVRRRSHMFYNRNKTVQQVPRERAHPNAADIYILAQKHNSVQIIPKEYVRALPFWRESLSARRRRIHFMRSAVKERRRSNYRHCRQIRWQSANPLLIAAKGLLRPRLHQAAQRRASHLRAARADPPRHVSNYCCTRICAKATFLLGPFWVRESPSAERDSRRVCMNYVRCGTCKIKSPTDRLRPLREAAGLCFVVVARGMSECENGLLLGDR